MQLCKWCNGVHFFILKKKKKKGAPCFLWEKLKSIISFFSNFSPKFHILFHIRHDYNTFRTDINKQSVAEFHSHLLGLYLPYGTMVITFIQYTFSSSSNQVEKTNFYQNSKYFIINKKLIGFAKQITHLWNIRNSIYTFIPFNLGFFMTLLIPLTNVLKIQ